MIEFLAEAPDRAYHLSELARQVGLDKSTCHPMLTELTRVGWLVKDRVKRTYRLGPRLVPIGAAARAAVPITDLARAAMERLSQDTGGMVCLVVASGDALVLAGVVRTPGAGAPDLPLRVGDRIEFAPPLGSVLVAFAEPYVVDNWLRARTTATASVRDTLAVVRRRRFAVELSPHSPTILRDRAAETLAQVYGSRRAARITSEQLPTLSPELLLGEIDERASYAPMTVNAACFDAHGRVACAISALGLADRLLSGRELAELGARVVRAADEITEQLGGEIPA